MLVPSTSRLANRWLWRIIVGCVLLIPLLVSQTGKDSFRLPKELIFRAETLLLVSICAAVFIVKKSVPAGWRDAAVIIPGAAILWSGITTLVATNRTLSVNAFQWIAGWAVIFVVTTALAGNRSVPVIYAALVPAAINAVLVLLQESDMWNPFFPGKSLEHALHSGLIGNPNDVGTFLVAPVVACFALLFASKSNRLLHIGTMLLLLVAVVANHTLTALAAISVGLIATVFMVSKRLTAVAVIVVAILVVAIVTFFPPLRARYDRTVRFFSAGYYDSVLSGRALPFLAASHMFLDRPVTGVGPGCFKWEYFPYKVRIIRRYEKLALTGKTINYGEVHNDHLQILAESGLPGYALFVAALIVIGSASFVGRGNTAESEFSRLASFPLAIAFAVVALGQFPLELAAATAVNIYLFALCRAWRPSANDADVAAEA
jgi:O-antigen ligase